MSWQRWQRVCGWVALVCAALWALKFTILSTEVLDPALAEPLVGFIIPTLGSILGLVFVFGLAAPFLTGKRLWIAIPVSIVTGIAAAFINNAVYAAAGDAMSGSANELLRNEGAILATSAWSLVAALWLLRPRTSARWFDVVLAVGGVLWLVKGVAVAVGAPLDGWVAAAYQLGLWLLVAAVLAFAVDVARKGRIAPLAIGVALYVAAAALGAIPVLGGELGLLVLAVGAITAGVVQWTRSSSRVALP